jgi:thiol-disulfide isomerase/thioredoxin
VRDRYTIVVGVLFAVVIAIALIEGPGGDEGRTLGLERQVPRWPLPEFAVPLAASSLEGDANVAQDDCEVATVPCPADDQRTPACRVRLAGAVRVCDLFDRPSVISFWFTKGGKCVDEQDAFDRVYRRYRGRVGFLSVDIRDSLDTVRDLIRERGWQVPVGYDRDGAVAALYRVGLCPTFAYVYPGGTLQSAGFGELDEAGLEARIENLLRATRAAELGGGDGVAG